MKLIIDIVSIAAGVSMVTVACYQPHIAIGVFFGVWLYYHLHDDLIGFPRPGKRKPS